jgi:hypothetical protein
MPHSVYNYFYSYRRYIMFCLYLLVMRQLSLLQPAIRLGIAVTTTLITSLRMGWTPSYIPSIHVHVSTISLTPPHKLLNPIIQLAQRLLGAVLIPDLEVHPDLMGRRLRVSWPRRGGRSRRRRWGRRR